MRQTAASVVMFAAQMAGEQPGEIGEADPGHFVILVFGVFAVVDGITSMAFSGHNRYGGTPPCPGPDQPAAPMPWQGRKGYIAYPTKAISDANHQLPIAGKVKEPVYVTLEMLYGVK
jgi:hypothetical protein